jgi:hypothetical protein
MIGVQNNFCGKNRREYDGSCASALALVMRLLKRAPHSSRLVRREPRGRASLTHLPLIQLRHLDIAERTSSTRRVANA